MARTWLTLSLLVCCAGSVGAQEPAVRWAGDLSAAEPGLWQARAVITVTNHGTEPTVAEPVPVAIGLGRLQLTGAAAESIRVTDEAGTELLYELRGPDGTQPRGPVVAGSELFVPATVPAGGSQRLVVYWDQPGAVAPPARLSLPGGLSNASFETGDTVPTGWSSSQGDGQHRQTWDAAMAHTGQRSMRIDVDAGAAPTWVGTRQTNLAARPGVRYRLSGWIRGENITGRVGWFVHVSATGEPLALNNVFTYDAGGTFDWREVSHEFVAPAGSTAMTIGTVLYGTGTAWHDDLSVEELDPPTVTLSATAGPVERLGLTAVGPGAWPGGALAAAICRTVVEIVNSGPAVGGQLIMVPVRGLLARLPAGTQFVPVDPATGAPLPSLLTGDDLLFLVDLPTDGLLRVPLYGLPAGGTFPALDWRALVDGPGNLAGNAGFEADDDAWAGGTEGEQAEGVRVVRAPGEGVDGGTAGLTEVPADAPPRWVGWRQQIDLPSPDGLYYYAARARSSELSAPARLYIHYLDEDRVWRDEAGGGSGPTISGDQDWTTLSMLTGPPAFARYIELHLTMNSTGRVWHDDVVLRPASQGRPGRLEAPPTPGAPLAVWTEDPIIKVLRDSLPKPTAPAHIWASRGERETLQVCLRSQVAGPATVSVDLPGFSPRVERVGYVPVYQPGGYFRLTAAPGERPLPRGTSRTDGQQGWWPDFLLPLDGPVELTADQVQPVWATVHVPLDTTPGDYAGTVTVTPAAGAPVTLPFTLTVWPFQQPARPTLQVIYDHRAGGDHQGWLEFAAERRISFDSLPNPEWSVDDAGQVTLDLTAFDREAELRFDQLNMSAAYLPSLFYVGGWAFPPGPKFGATYPSPEWRSRYQQAVQQIWEHCKARGWAPYVSLYLSDEPFFEQPEVTAWLGDVMEMIQEVAPDLPIYSSTWRHNPAWDGLLSHWGVGQHGSFPVDEMVARQAAGDKMWFTTDGHMEIDTPYAATERMLPWYCFAHNVSGYEFWGIDWWTYNPFEYGWHSSIPQSDGPDTEGYHIRYPNGDGYLAYPGDRVGLDGPVSTIRLENARDGVEDYDLMHALQVAAAADPALAARAEPIFEQIRALMVIPNSGGWRTSDWLPDPYAPARLRQAVGDLLAETQR